MNYNNHYKKQLVCGVCKNCNRTFYRDGDLMTFSTSYSTPSFNNSDLSIDNVKTYIDWLIFSSNYCDECLPPRPKEVDEDIKIENQRRQADINNYYMFKNQYKTPMHENKNLKEIKQKNVSNNISKRSSFQRKDSFRKKISKCIPNALYFHGKNN